MEGAALVAEALLAGAESSEVLGSSGNNVASELHDDSAGCGAANAHVKVNSWKRHSKIKRIC